MSDAESPKLPAQPPPSKSIIGQIWEKCLSAEGDDTLSEEIRGRLQGLLKTGTCPGKEALEKALFPPVTEQ